MMHFHYYSSRGMSLQPFLIEIIKESVDNTTLFISIGVIVAICIIVSFFISFFNQRIVKNRLVQGQMNGLSRIRELNGNQSNNNKEELIKQIESILSSSLKGRQFKKEHQNTIQIAQSV